MSNQSAMLRDSIESNVRLRQNIRVYKERTEQDILNLSAQNRFLTKQADRHSARAEADRDTIKALRREMKRRRKVSGIYIGILAALWFPYTILCVQGLCSILIPASMLLGILGAATAGGWTK